MKTSLFGGRPLRIVTRRRRQVETLSKPLQSFISAEYLTTESTGATFIVAETLQAPSQSSSAQTVMPVAVSELTLTPEQSAIAGTSINVIINETTLAPVQAITAETSGTKKKNKPWASYYPPILTIRTNGSQEAPAPGERIRAKFNEAPVPIKVIEAKPVYSTMARQSMPTPIQAIKVKSHREVKAMRREEQDILTLLASL